MSDLDLLVRPAEVGDCEIIAEFNCLLAEESEDTHLDAATIRAGVQALLADSHKGRYFMACVGDRIVGQLMHTREWSDWRNGHIWWLQSVYVHPDFRRQGVFRRLYDHLVSEAEGDPNVVGIRLYVEPNNDHAQKTYRDLGMHQPGYFVMQRFFD